MTLMVFARMSPIVSQCGSFAKRANVGHWPDAALAARRARLIQALGDRVAEQGRKIIAADRRLPRVPMCHINLYEARYPIPAARAFAAAGMFSRPRSVF
jgi:hypothetical protein